MSMSNINQLLSATADACRSYWQPAINWCGGTPYRPAYLLIAGVLVACVVWRAASKRNGPRRSHQQSRDAGGRATTLRAKAACEEPGVWLPSDFQRPDPPPYPGWDVQTTKPLPYRPFRYGPYYITMGLRSMKWEDWIELDNEYLKFHQAKRDRIAERGPRLSKTAPEAFDGACELLEEFCDYLPKRYPSLFRQTKVGMDNLLTGESFNIVERPLKEDPMQMAARMVQDDLALLFEGSDGEYYLLAGSIMLPGTWRLEDKFRMPLSEIHTSGNVPGFKTKLEKGMVNFFRRVQPDAPVLRNNYFIQIDDSLGWSHSLGKEDDAGHGNGGAGQTAKTGWAKAERNKPIEHHWLRSERQSLRRLPRTGCMVFTIRPYFHPITDIAKEPGVPGRLASGVRSWGDDVAQYKGRYVYQDVLLDYLDGMHRQQVEQGVVTEDGEPVDSYPW